MATRDVRPLWEPTAEVVESSRLTHYLRWLDRGFRDYRELWEWSVTDVEGCWRRSNIDPLCRLNIDPGTGAAFATCGCG